MKQKQHTKSSTISTTPPISCLSTPKIWDSLRFSSFALPRFVYLPRLI